MATRARGQKFAKESGEDRLIARHFKPIAWHPGALGLTDDAAMLTPPPGHTLVVTADANVGGVHFFPDDPPDAIARKALRVNLSDLAAKGAKAAGFVLTLALPKGVGDDWLKAFARGLGADAKTYDCPLLGGDTVYTPGPVAISITAFGTLPKATMVKRSGARVGDHVIVTGTIGDAALGLKLRKERGATKRWKLDTTMRRHLLARYLVPNPRNALAEALRRNASAAMDVSDGLVGDLGKLCRASGVGADESQRACRWILARAGQSTVEAQRLQRRWNVILRRRPACLRGASPSKRNDRSGDERGNREGSEQS